MLFPDALIPELLARYQTLNATPMPSPNEIGAMLSLAFFSSLESDEQRAVRFSLALLNAEQFTYCAENVWSPLPFRERRSATIPEITKLASATDFRQTLIGLTCAGNDLFITGLIRTNLDQYRMSRDEAHHVNRVLLWYPRVTAPAPGFLNIGIQDYDLLHYSKGTKIPKAVNVLRDPGPVLDQIRENSAKFSPPLGSHGTRLYARVVSHMIQHIVDQHHGGTVVLLPTCDLPASMNVKYRTDGLDLKLPFMNYCSAAERNIYPESTLFSNPHTTGGSTSTDATSPINNQQRWLIAERYLQDAVSACANLANVDGAVVLSPRLDVVGFGAMFSWDGSSQPPIKLATDCQAHVVALFDLLEVGARHRSAAWFCHNNPGALAFVVSEDGPVSCVLKPSAVAPMLIWRHISLSWLDSEAPTRRTRPDVDGS